MRQDEHLKRTNGVGEEVHKFMDQYSRAFGPDHRVVLHHRMALRIIAQKFGPQSVPIAEQHIKDDWNGELPESFLDGNFYRVAWAVDARIFLKAVEEAKRLLRALK